MFCINCGTQLPDGAKFCNKCGAMQGGSGPSGTGPVQMQPGNNPAASAPKQQVSRLNTNVNNYAQKLAVQKAATAPNKAQTGTKKSGGLKFLVGGGLAVVLIVLIANLFKGEPEDVKPSTDPDPKPGVTEQVKTEHASRPTDFDDSNDNVEALIDYAKRLEEAGYSYSEVQSKVNQILSKK